MSDDHDRVQRAGVVAEALEAYWRGQHHNAWVRIGQISLALEYAQTARTQAERQRWLTKARALTNPATPLATGEST